MIEVDSSLDRQLDGTVGFALNGRRHLDLDTPALQGFSPRGEMASLARLPLTADEHDGYFALVGMNIWRSATYQYDTTFEIEPRPEFPNAPYVEPPCVVYEEVVPGYGPDYSEGFWSNLGLTEQNALRLLFIWANPVEAAQFGREALEIAEQVLNGCVAAVAEFFDSILDAAALVEDFFLNPQAFIDTKIGEIQAAVDAAVADPNNAITTVVQQVLKLDLLAENPARWVGEVGCEILVDILTGVATAKIAERVLDFINTKKRDVDFDAGCNSFPAGTLVAMADGTRQNIETIEPGDRVLAYSTETDSWSIRDVTNQWGHLNEGPMTSLIFEDGSSVESTARHLYWSQSAGTESWSWTAAEALKRGDVLESPSGEVLIGDVETSIGSANYVWELSIATDHTFAVSSSTFDVVVHNALSDRCLVGLADNTHGRAVRDAGEGTPQGDLLESHGQRFETARNSTNNDPGLTAADKAIALAKLDRAMQTHHIVSRKLFDGSYPDNFSAERRTALEAMVANLEARPDGLNELDNLIPMPTSAQAIELTDAGALDGWNPDAWHSGNHPDSYYEDLADLVVGR